MLRLCSLPLLLFMLLLTSCSQKGTWQDDAIDYRIRKELDETQKAVTDAIRKSDVKAVQDLFAEKLHKGEQDSLEIIVRSLARKNWDQATLFHRFHSRNKKGEIATISTGTGDHDFSVVLSHEEEDVAYSILLLPDSVYTGTLAISYRRVPGKGWRISNLYGGMYMVYHLDAVGWYNRAEQEYSHNEIVNTFDHIEVARLLMKPGGPFLQYNQAERISTLLTDMSALIRSDYQLPLSLDAVAGTPYVAGISPNLFDGDAYPSFDIRTSVPVSDTAALNRQCTEIHENIGKYFTHAQYNKYVFYRFFNDLPSPANPEPPSVLIRRYPPYYK